MTDYVVVVGVLVVDGKTVGHKETVKLSDEVAAPLVKSGVVAAVKTEAPASPKKAAPKKAADKGGE